MKSAYEIAMERLGKAAPEPKLTDAQKTELAEINSLYKSKIAERETFLQSKIAELRSSGELAEVEAIQTQLARDLAVLQEEWDEKKERVWKAVKN
jgi:hypothetical protein